MSIVRDIRQWQSQNDVMLCFHGINKCYEHVDQNFKYIGIQAHASLNKTNSFAVILFYRLEQKTNKFDRI